MFIPSDETLQAEDIPTIEKIPFETRFISIDSIQNDLNLFSPPSSKKKLPSQTESIKTFCRIRPFNGINEIFIIKPDDDKVLQINTDRLPRNQAAQKQVNSYTFSKTFGDRSTQNEVFEVTCKQQVEDLLYKKKSGLIFTYGMTNAGKTFTVTGTPTAPGILPQSLKYLLDNFSKVSSNCTLYCNFVEIYQEDVFDLLSTDPFGKNKFYKKKISVKENNRNIFYLSDATYLQLGTVEEFNNALNKGISKKAHSATNLNQNSSRSHTIFKIILREKDIVYDDPNMLDISLSIVDLAGSERANRTETSGKELQEACKINQSLSVLGKSLEAMKHNSIYTQKKMVPFRESKLTKLFCEYFQGEQNIIMITNINPRKEDFEETLRALNYSCIAKEIKPIKSRINNHNPMRKIVKVNNVNNNKGRSSNEFSSSSLSLLTPLSNSSTACINENSDNIDLASDSLNPNCNNNTLLALHDSVGANDTISNLILEIQKLRYEVSNIKCTPSIDKEMNNKTVLPSLNSTPMNYDNCINNNHHHNTDAYCNQLQIQPYEQMIQQLIPQTNNNNQLQMLRGLMGGSPMQRMPGVNLFFINSKFNDFNLAKTGLIPEENESEEEDNEDEEEDRQYERKRYKKGNKKQKQNQKQIKRRNKSMQEKKLKRDNSENHKENKKEKKLNAKRGKKNAKGDRDRDTSAHTPAKRILVPQAYEEPEVLNSKIEINELFDGTKAHDMPGYATRRTFINERGNEIEDISNHQRIISEFNKDKISNVDHRHKVNSIDTKSTFFFRTQPKSKFGFWNGF